MSAAELGYEAGQTCNRNGCAGVIEEREDSERGCSCHINPPCGYCTTPREACPECDWRLVDDETTFNDFRVGPVKPNGEWTHYRPRPLDPTKIDWRTEPHTHFTMVKVGVYPPETTKAEVEALVRGTFGGRFDQFGGGRFRYVAYTD